MIKNFLKNLVCRGHCSRADTSVNTCRLLLYIHTVELKNFKTDLEIELVYYCYSIIHPFISFHVSKVGSQWQQVKQGIPDIFPHSNTFMFSVKSFQSQTRYINLGSGSSLCIWKNSKWRQLGDILTRCPSYCRCLILGISQSLANHSAVC